MLGKRPDPATFAGQHWDLIVVGGGITGAGILLEAARRGRKVLLLEQQDFAWGTSSRSSKMVHGGLRYLGMGDIRLTRHSLLERERLLKELPDMVVRHPYIFPIRRGQFPGRWPMKAVLWLYDFLAGIRDHHWLSREKLCKEIPGLNGTGLVGAMRYTDALTDDSRLVARVLHEACAHGAQACNYAEVARLEKNDRGFSVAVKDRLNEVTVMLHADHVINATGAWADRLSGTEKKVRPQRGSHLFVPQQRLPVDSCLTILHPDDGRPVFVFPWEGVTCIGTTDLDHPQSLDQEPRCTRGEVDYLLKLVNSQFPEVALNDADILSTMAGVRPIIASGKGLDPSKERRDHAVWENNGVITVSGGKLTTFRLIALDALLAAGLIDQADHKASQAPRDRQFTAQVSPPHQLGQPLAPVPEDKALLEQLDWVLQHEMVAHLDDLLLRRTRVGNLRADAGVSVFDALQTLCEKHLGWDAQRWQDEVSRYQIIRAQYYGVPEDKAA